MIAVALSGGVDSAVAAYLLAKEGWRIFGVFAQTWTPQPGDGTDCTWREDRRDALRVAAALDIPLYTIDLERQYRRDVVGALMHGYEIGETPNPDVICNQRIKFDALWTAARRLGATKLATGHYAQIESGDQGPQLLRGQDPAKDQSYFLWRIPRSRLGSIVFPIGHLLKKEVRAIALKADLPVAHKQDSQGICFLGQTNLKQFLGSTLPPRPGDILDWESRQVIGQHDGTHFLTIGQRHRVGSIPADSPVTNPRYIVDIDRATNRVWVGPREQLYERRLELRELTWLDREGEHLFRVKGALDCFVQIRYHQAEVRAEIVRQGSRVLLETALPVLAPTPGQSAVFSEGRVLIGGAVIHKVLRTPASRPVRDMVGSRES